VAVTVSGDHREVHDRTENREQKTENPAAHRIPDAICRGSRDYGKIYKEVFLRKFAK